MTESLIGYRITITDGTILIAIEGTGDSERNPVSDGNIIQLVLVNSVPEVALWGDINSLAPTHHEHMDGALEFNRMTR